MKLTLTCLIALLSTGALGLAAYNGVEVQVTPKFTHHGVASYCDIAWGGPRRSFVLSYDPVVQNEENTRVHKKGGRQFRFRVSPLWYGVSLHWRYEKSSWQALTGVERSGDDHHETFIRQHVLSTREDRTIQLRLTSSEDREYLLLPLQPMVVEDFFRCIRQADKNGGITSSQGAILMDSDAIAAAMREANNRRRSEHG